MEDVIRGIRIRGALQQPAWKDLRQLRWVGEELAARPALVQAGDVATLRSLLGRVALGEAMVLQSGDCAEDPQECTPEHIARKAALLDLLAGTLGLLTGKPVVRAGRIAGQFAKPRSQPTEVVDGVELPAFRGHMVNGPERDLESRQPDPLRILTGYMSASDIVERLGWCERAAGRSTGEPLVWTSHEALLLDYEIPMLRTDEEGKPFLGSTHWPWIGERTRQVDGAHVALLAEVSNPVACKVGPTMEPGELLALCERLDPWRDPGRLTLIARMGVRAVTDRLPPLVEAVRDAGHRVVWLTDPMHGNTTTAPCGRKTRLVPAVSLEVSRFVEAVRAAGGVPGGLHLETTPDDVTECVRTEAELDTVGERYTSHCDPRLTPGQAVSVVSAWTARDSHVRDSTLHTSHVEPGTGAMTGIPPITAYALPSEFDLPSAVVPWTAEPDRSVLLLHDMQRYFLRPFPDTVRCELIDNAAQLRDRCARLGVPVAYTAQPGGMTDEQRGLLKDFWGPGMRPEPEDRQVVAPLTPAADDWVLTKWRYSAFFKTDLLQRMRAEGRDQLILCGVYAHVGVLATALEAFSNDIQPFFVADATADFSQDHHRSALSYAAERCALVTTAKGVFA